MTKGQTLIYKLLHRNKNIEQLEQLEPHSKLGWNQGVRKC